MPALLELSGLGEIPADWVHIDKQVTPRPDDDLALPSGYLKWYDVHAPDSSVAAAVRGEAREFLRAEVSAGSLDLQRELGFVVLHRSGDFHFLIACVWRNINEMWQALYVKPMDGAFAPARGAAAFKPTQCLWELGPTVHERAAWSRYLFSPRDDAAKRAYLEDRLTGLG